MSIATSGIKNGMFGKKRSEDYKSKQRQLKQGFYTRQWFIDEYGENIGNQEYHKRIENLSINRMGSKNHFFGKTHTAETREKIIKNTPRRFGKQNKSYVDFDILREFIINTLITTKNISETTRRVNEKGIKCSRMAIKGRIKEWNIYYK